MENMWLRIVFICVFLLLSHRANTYFTPWNEPFHRPCLPKLRNNSQNNRDLNKDATICSLAPLWPPSKMKQQIHLTFDFTSEVSSRAFWFRFTPSSELCPDCSPLGQSQRRLTIVSISATRSEGPHPQLSAPQQATLMDPSQLFLWPLSLYPSQRVL